MARQADSNIQTRAARLKLRPRVEPYYVQIAPKHTLGYIKHAKGAGTFCHRWQDEATSNYKRSELGRADDLAQANGRDVLAFDQALRKATNPGAKTPDGRLTVSVALDRYFTTLAGSSKHAAAYRAVSDKHIVPALGGHRINKLTKSQIEHWLAGLVREDDDDEDARRKSQDTANRVLTHLKASLNAAFADDANGISTDAAWRRVKPFKDVARPREDDLDSKQVRLLIAKAATFDAALARLLEAGYLTGARLGELVAAKVRDLNVGKRTLQVDGKTGPRTVSLTDECAHFLGRHSEGHKRDAPLLPREDGERWAPQQHCRGVRSAVALAELPPTVCYYTLRHAHVSRAIEAGMPLSLIAKNCGTSLSMIDRNYQHVLALTRQDTIQKTSPRLRRVK